MKVRWIPAAMPAIPAPLVDVVLVAIALVDVWTLGDNGERLGIACAMVAAVALLLRRRVALWVFLATVPSVIFSWAVIAPQIALFALARRTRNRALLASLVVLFAVCYAVPWPATRPEALAGFSTLVMLGYGLANAAAPVFLGQLVQARHDLAARLAEITEAREHERLLTAQNVLAKERAQLAREMHDVVSHQVSLIAVRAGALQVRTRDPDTKEAAVTIRRLSVQTLDELRHMVSVLRASGGRPTELTPQPALDQLQALVAGSGIETDLDIDLPGELSPPMQRAIYRTVQEALTNVRKHAPGASAAVHIRHEDGAVHTTVTNTAPTRPTIPLPSGKHGLIGLRQRAELLGGTLDAGPAPDQGYRLRLRLPLDRP